MPKTSTLTTPHSARAQFPLTFQVALREPFGLFTRESYLFHLHASSLEAALAWLIEVFAGVNVRPMLHRWSNSSVSVGNNDPTRIVNCDNFSISHRPRVRSSGADQPRSVAGAFRRSTEEVADDLRQVHRKLLSDEETLRRRFAEYRAEYEADPRARTYLLLTQLRDAHALARTWATNVQVELARIAQNNALELPPVLHTSSAAVAA